MSADANSHGSDPREQSIGELVKDLATETSTLVRQELDLAKAEMAQKGKQAGLGAGMFGGAGVSALLGLGALTAAVIAALDIAMPLWLAALIVAVIWLAVAGVLGLTGKTKVQQATPPLPEQTQESVKEDVEWAKTQARSARR
jgi:uncharacterized membrane protein YqjE